MENNFIAGDRQGIIFLRKNGIPIRNPVF